MRRLLGKTLPEERRRIIAELFSLGQPGQWHRFAVLMALSVVIATMGLSLNSAAVVIGAMLLAPLMRPVIALSAALAMGWPGQLLKMASIVIATSGGSVGLAWLLTKIQPGADVTPEILARTAPDGRDMAVALAAGAAGAYATAREQISGALPGVAVAVALVPPLTTIGVTLELERYDLALGAGLLYSANLVGIALLSTVVLLLTGFVPVARLSQVRPRLVLGGLVVLAAMVGIAVPLTQQSVAFADEKERLDSVRSAVTTWLGTETTLEIEGIHLDSSHVTLDLSGPEAPPPARELALDLADELGERVEIEVRWSQSSVGIGTLAEPVEDSTIDADDLRPFVQEWLDNAAGDGPRDRIEAIELNGAEVVVSVVGPVAPPSVSTLATAVQEQLETAFEFTVRWTEQQLFESDAPPDARAILRDTVRRWAAEHPGLLVAAVDFGTDTVIIDLVGDRQPTDAFELVGIVEDTLGEQTNVRVRFTQRTVIAQQTVPSS